MTFKQLASIKSSIVNINNCLNGIYNSFDSINKEFHLGRRLVDLFPNQFSFHKADQKPDKSKTHHCKLLNKIVFKASFDPLFIVVISDTSIKTISLYPLCIYSFNSPLKKILHHTINVTSMKAELFTIQYRINQAIYCPNISCIIIITDTLYVAKHIFNSLIHLYQIQVIVISKDL